MSMIVKSNVHVHTSWCDGSNSPREMVEAALIKGFSDIGFSSHAPPKIKGPGPGISDIDAYIKEISSLRDEYAGRINILCGAEQDSYALVDKNKFDYIIHSEHSFPVISGNYDSVDKNPSAAKKTFVTRFRGDGIAMAGEYFEFLLSGVKFYHPDIVGHYDLIAKFNSANNMFDRDSAEYQNLAVTYLDEIISTIIDYGGMIEINTSGVRYKKTGYPYAGEPFMLKRILERKARVIITGDSHSAEMIDYKFNETLELLKTFGFSSVAVLLSGRFTDVSI